MHKLLASTVGAVVLLAGGQAMAKEAKADDHFLPEWVSVGVGFVGNVGGNFFDKPDDQTVQGVTVESDYPGFAGLTTGFGPILDVRFLGFVGLEMDVLFTHDVGEADLEFTIRDTAGNVQKFDYTIEIGHDAVHLPLLLKGSIPGEWVQPMLFIGPEFVFASDPQFKVLGGNCPNGSSGSGTFRCTGDGTSTTPNSAVYSASADDYTMLTFGLGLEIMLPIPMVDIRIPFSLRGSYNPGVSDKRDERADPAPVANGTDLQSETFKTNWKFAAAANFGASWHF